jgi:hypothetical protein
MKVNIKQYNSKTSKAWTQKESWSKGPKRPRPVYAEGLRGVEKEVWLKRRTEFNQGKWFGAVEYIGSEDITHMTNTHFGYGTGPTELIKGKAYKVVEYREDAWLQPSIIVEARVDDEDKEILCHKDYFKPVNATAEEIQYAIIEKEIYGKIR